MMQIKLIFTTKVSHLASFESGIFWNSEMAYESVCIKKPHRTRVNWQVFKSINSDHIFVNYNYSLTKRVSIPW